MGRASWILMAVLTGLVSLASAQDQIRWQPNLETAQRVAAQSNRLVLVHCWAPWCKPCMTLEQEVFAQAEVGRQLEANFVCVKLNVEESPATARMYHVTSLPTDVILTPSGRLVAQLESPRTAQQYVDKVNRIADGHKQLVANGGGGAGAPVVTSPAGTMASAAPAAAMAAQSPPAQQPQTAYGPSPEATAAQSRYTDNRYAHILNQPLQVPPQQSAPPQQPAAAGADNYAGGPYGPQAPQAWQAQQPATPPPAAPPAAPAMPPQAQLSTYNPTTYQSMTPPQAPAAPQVQSPYAATQTPTQSPVQQVAVSTPSVQLPPGSPPLGLEGYCPVTLTEERRWLPGDRRWGAIHRGRTYLFTGPAQQQRFLANPDIYSPVMSGNDPVLALDARQEASGRREHGVFFDNRIYLFSNEQSLEAFNKNPKRYAAEVMQAMR